MHLCSGRPRSGVHRTEDLSRPASTLTGSSFPCHMMSEVDYFTVFQKHLAQNMQEQPPHRTLPLAINMLACLTRFNKI